MAAPTFLQLIAGVVSRVSAAVVGGASSANQLVGTNNAGLLDVSLMPAGIGPDTVSAPATEAIAAGAPVNLYNASGTLSLRNADANTANAGKKCDGFVLAAVASGATGTMYRSGQNTSQSSLTVGADYYLGASGAVTITPDTTVGHTSQRLGKALSATTLDFQPETPIAIVS